MIWLAVAFMGCQSPEPLPPSHGYTQPRASRMLSNGEVTGYLVDARSGNDGTLLLVDELNTRTRTRAPTLADGPIFVIPATVDTQKARLYFMGLKGVDSVRIVCERNACPEELNTDQ